MMANEPRSELVSRALAAVLLWLQEQDVEASARVDEAAEALGEGMIDLPETLLVEGGVLVVERRSA